MRPGVVNTAHDKAEDHGEQTEKERKKDCEGGDSEKDNRQGGAETGSRTYPEHPRTDQRVPEDPLKGRPGHSQTSPNHHAENSPGKANEEDYPFYGGGGWSSTPIYKGGKTVKNLFD